MSSYSFDVKSEEIHDKSLTMILAIQQIVEDCNSNKSNPLFASEQTSIQPHTGLKPNEFLQKLLQFMSNPTKIAFVIGRAENEHIKFCNYILIVDGYESFR